MVEMSQVLFHQLWLWLHLLLLLALDRPQKYCFPPEIWTVKVCD